MVEKIIYSGGPIDTKNYTIINFNIPEMVLMVFILTIIRILILQILLEFLKKLLISLMFLGYMQQSVVPLELDYVGMASLFPDFIRNLIPIAGDWKSTDWMIANTTVQNEI